MAHGKLISLWCKDAVRNRQALAQELAHLWCEEGRQALLIEFQNDALALDPARWMHRFQTLTPQMLRNFLASPTQPWGQLNLAAIPRTEPARELFALLRGAYDWVLALAPCEFSADMPILLEASDAVFWLTDGKPNPCPEFDAFLQQLTRYHYPHSFAHLLAKQPYRSNFLKTIQKLAFDLENRSDLTRPAVGASAPVSETVLDHLRDHVQPELMKAIATQSSLDARHAQEAVEAYLAKDASLPASLEDRGKIVQRVLHDVMGLGPLEPLLEDATVSEIMVNGAQHVYVEKKGRLYESDIRFASDKQLRIVIDRIVTPLGRRVDESMPICDGRLADGSRVNVVLPPLALDGPTVTIRKFSARALGLDELEELGSLSNAMNRFLVRAVRARRNIIVSGGTGSGKTTLLNALSGVIPDEERIVTIEDAAELRLQKPHVVRLESRPPNAEGSGAIPIRRLVMNALRMRPDRIVVGECRGGEALDMLQAMNTGHDGSMTTLHANAPRDAFGRLETLVLMAGMDLPVRVVREQIRSAVHIVVQQARLADGSRKVTSVTEVTGMEGDVLTTQELFRFRDGHFGETGLRSTGVPS